MTFSIVARCPKTLALGIGVSTAAPAVGSKVPHVKENIGAIATQANTSVDYGVKGLELLGMGFSPRTSLEAMLKEDSERATRQVIIIGKNGRVAAFTGRETIPWKGNFVGKDFAAAGNMLTGESVLTKMREKFESSDGHLAERILKALEAGDAAGGDKRGKLSAALSIVGSNLEKSLRFSGLRVDFSPDPVKELRRVFDSYRNSLHTS